MSKYKTAGLILGVLFFIIAVVLIIISGKLSKNNKNVDKVESSQTTVVEQVSSENNKQEEVVSTNNEQIKPVETQVVEKITTVTETKELSGVRTIDEDVLSSLNPVSKSFITVISNKRLLLIDEDSEGTGNKMLTYCFDMFGPQPDNLPISLYVTKLDYDKYEIGEQLSVDYIVYTNDLGVKFPVITSISTVNN